MFLIDHPSSLRTVLRVDAAICVATGLLMTAGASPVSELTQIPAGLVTAAGASLFPIAAFMAFAAARVPGWTSGVWLAILGNIGWVLGSVWLLAGGIVKPNALGVAFVLVQAAAVAILVALEYAGLRNVDPKRARRAG